MPLRFLSLLVIATCALFPTTLPAQKSLLQSGPMLGYADLKEVLLWAQTTRTATVQFEYWDVEFPRRIQRTDKIITEKNTAFTAKCLATGLEPGRTYGYRLRINGRRVALPYATTFKTQPLWRWRTDPPTFTVATGSCAYVNEPQYDRPGKPYGSNYQIFTSIYQQKPDLMLWLGDNTYTREPDWATRNGMLYRYTHTRALPELQPLLASVNQYAIWDDHDFGPDNSDGNWPLKADSWEVFKAFWGNPTFGVGDGKGCTTFFQYNDVDFFLLDDRYFRSPDRCTTCDRTMLGHAQVEWLIGSLSSSRAPFKIVAVGNQFLSTDPQDETFSGLYPAERDTILARIERENIKGVIFLTGDRHFTELSALKNARGNWVYDLTTSPFTSGVYAKGGETHNALRVEGTVAAQHNFALLRFSGPRTDRQLDISVHDANGQLLWTKALKATEL